MRAALGLLRMYATSLCIQDMEQIMALLVHFPDDIDVDDLLENIDKITISARKYEQMRHKFDMVDQKYNMHNGVYGVTAMDMGGARSAQNTPLGDVRSGKRYPVLNALGLLKRPPLPGTSQSTPGTMGVAEGDTPDSSSDVLSPQSPLDNRDPCLIM